MFFLLSVDNCFVLDACSKASGNNDYASKMAEAAARKIARQARRVAALSAGGTSAPALPPPKIILMAKPRSEPVRNEPVGVAEPETGTSFSLNFIFCSVQSFNTYLLIHFFAALPIVEIIDKDAETPIQTQVYAESDPLAEVGEGSGLRHRKRQRGEGSSQIPYAGPSRLPEVTLPQTSKVPPPQPSEATRLILGEFSAEDSAVEPSTARRLNQMMVLPADRERFRAPSWEGLLNAFHINLALVSSFFSEYLYCDDT